MELPQLLAEHPWPAEMLRMGSPLEQTWTLRSRLAAEELWLWLRDTSRLNRALGLGEMHFEEDERGRIRGRSETAGIKHVWTEHPWSWVAAQQIVAVREYQYGLAHWVRAIYRFEPLPEGCELTVYFGWIPRGLFQRVVLATAEGWLQSGYRRVVQEIEDSQLAQRLSPWEQPGASSEVDWPTLRRKQTQMLEAGHERAMVARLGDWLADADDLDLARIQVLKLAQDWGLPQREVLELALHATRAGLLSLSWDVVCPHCRGVRESCSELSGIPAAASCPSCAVDFDTQGPRAIEIVFHVHPSIRKVPKRFYCSAEPAQKAHIALQQHLAPGQSVVLPTRLPAGQWRLRVAGHSAELRLGEGPERVELTPTCPDLLAGAEPTLRLDNPLDQPATFVLEHSEPPSWCLRPRQLFALQDFRDLFAEEYLSADVRLALGEQTVLFTDVVGSTRLYLDRGDPAAFSHIKTHFEELLGIVRAHDGVVVKTIGDALMASFLEPVQALQASLEMQRAFPPDRADTPIRLRISLNTGPCIAVRLNSNIDYFGTTVNLAAKLQACADGSQVAFSDQVARRQEVCGWLEEQGLEAEETALHNATLGHPRAWRFTVG
jgi:class 3 adenylate cyclase